MSIVAIVRRFAFLWAALNLAGMALYLRLASALWPLPGEEHLPGGPGDAFFWFFAIVPLVIVATIANLGALVFVVRNRKRHDGLTNTLVWAIVAALWLCAVIYGENRTVRRGIVALHGDLWRARGPVDNYAVNVGQRFSNSGHKTTTQQR